MANFFDDYKWHSAAEPGESVGRRRILRKLVASDENVAHFDKVAKSQFLIHKSTKALWRFSSDNKTIVPVFDDDVITEENF